MTKLILGTANFGQPYGIKGDPVPSLNELERIARVAWDGGIRVIHTSWQYNLPKICEAIFDEFEWIEKSREDPDWFRYKSKNVFNGVSLYDIPARIRDPYRIEIFQIPINILDNRFLHNFNLQGIRNTEIKIHVRSVFLQGLLLMDCLPDWMLNHLDAYNMIVEFHHICNEMGLESYEAALGWVLGLKDIDHVIVGVNSAEQLAQLLDVKSLQWDYDFSIQDENVLDPRRWPK